MTQRPNSVTDRATLAAEAYADDRYLAARQALYKWQSPRYDLPSIVANELRCTQGTLIDVGCGNGKFLKRFAVERPDLQLVGLDIAPGMLAGIPACTVLGDAHRLPFPDDVASVVLVAHMLYHVDDIDQVLSEVRRVLRPGGIVVASTNSATDKVELDDLWSAAAGDVLGVEHGPRRVSLSSRFTLEDAPAVLGRHFSDVRLIELPGLISVTDPEPIVAHMASYRAWAADCGVPFDPTLERARQRVERTLVERGSFDIRCLGGIFFARSR